MPHLRAVLPFLPGLAAALPLAERDSVERPSPVGKTLGVVFGLVAIAVFFGALVYVTYFGRNRTVQTDAHGPFVIHDSPEANLRAPSPGVEPYVPRPPAAVVRGGPAAREEWELQEMGRLREAHRYACHGMTV